ncbi:MAG: FGGY family carbohydrate kinase, partial [Flavobacteriales bacterium]
MAFGTVDSWLVWKLTNGERHITDASNASRTMLFDLHAMDWDPTLCDLFQIPASMLPTVVPNSGNLAEAKGFDVPVPITGIAGDQQAALFGQQCTRPGMVKNTYGTGCFMLMNTGSKAVPSKHALLTTVAWQLNGQTTYALEGSVFIGGAAVQWLRDELNFIEASPEIEALALAVDSSDGVVVVPAFAGLGAPHWNPHARGSILGMTRGTNRSHIARATLESIAFQSMDLMDCMQ